MAGSEIWVVVDANVIVNDLLLNGAGWTRLSRMGKEGRISIGIPSVVFEEAVGVYRRRVAEHDGKMRDAVEHLRRIGVSAELPSVDHDAAARSYRSLLDQRMAAASASLLPEPEVSLRDLTSQAIDRRRPFDGDGNGFRDALVWASVVALGNHPNVGLVHLASQDKRAFYADKKSERLHPDLAREVETARLAPVRVASSLASIAEGIAATDSEVRKQIEQVLTNDARQIRTNILHAIAQGDFDVDGGSRFTISEVKHLADPKLITAATAIPGSPVQVELRTSADLRGRFDLAPGEAVVDITAEVLVDATFEDGQLGDMYATTYVELDHYPDFDDAGYPQSWRAGP